MGSKASICGGWHLPLLGDMKTQVIISSLGFAIFGVGTEAIGITISKAVVRWFKGREMALAMGMQMSIARLGTALAFAFPCRSKILRLLHLYYLL